MTRWSDAPQPAAQIDIGNALDLLDAAVKQCGEYFVHPSGPASGPSCSYSAHGGARCLVGEALWLAYVDDDDLERLDGCDIRALYAQGRLPIRLTLGAVIVFDAAQRIADHGFAWGDALDYATDAAARYLDLVRDLRFDSGPATIAVARHSDRLPVADGHVPDVYDPGLPLPPDMAQRR